MIGRGEFLEWADVFGNLYGTARHDTETALAAGQDVVLVIDVQGARQVRARTSEAVSIFVLPPSFQALETRLRGRCQDDEAAITRRLDTARSDVSAVEAYEYVVVNDDVDRCVGELAAIVTAERARRTRRLTEIDGIVKTFKR
jgi:guanylate kinase